MRAASNLRWGIEIRVPGGDWLEPYSIVHRSP